jgi:hypothetical protein
MSDTVVAGWHDVGISQMVRGGKCPVYVHAFELADVMALDLRLRWHVDMRLSGFEAVLLRAKHLFGSELKACNWLNWPCAELCSQIPLRYGSTKAKRTELLFLLAHLAKDRKRQKNGNPPLQIKK